MTERKLMDLQPGIIYGPMASRRFGVSLGVNLLPGDAKACLFDCVYCQYGQTEGVQGGRWPKYEEICAALEEGFKSVVDRKPAIDFIMLAGNGEPTAHPDFLRVAEKMRVLRDQILPGVPLGILSNSAMVYKPSVREALGYLDQRFMKLDAGGDALFRKVNRPLSKSIHWDQMVEGLSLLENITLQSLFIEGAYTNTQGKDVDEWIETVKFIGPQSVQVYTVDRPTAMEDVAPVSLERLQEIALLAQKKTKIPCEVFGPKR